MSKKLIAAMLALFGAAGPVSAGDAETVERFQDAVAVGDLMAVKEMLAADPRLAVQTGDFGFSAMQLQDVWFDPAILDLLLAEGADINSANDEGVTLLHLVTDPEAVPILVGKGADLEARDIRGWTPLIMQTSSQENGPAVVEALLKAGADPAAKGLAGETALSLAETGGGAPALVELLRAAERR